MPTSLLLATLMVLLAVALWLGLPRCPECGSTSAERDDLDVRLRTCRRCCNIYEVRAR